MHQRVYPRLLMLHTSLGVVWDPNKERDEGKRLRRMIRSIITGRPIDHSKSAPGSGNGRKESFSAGKLSSAGPDATDSPNVSEPVFFLSRALLIC